MLHFVIDVKHLTVQTPWTLVKSFGKDHVCFRTIQDGQYGFDVDVDQSIESSRLP